jgi:Methane oxygenase PmoA
MKLVFTALLLVILAIEGSTQPTLRLAQGRPNTMWQLVERKEKKQIDILYKNQRVTSYCYYDSVMKPILFPLNTLSGITVSRGYPLEPRPGDHVDHPHHVGLWLTYESVNGLDFWNNSTAIPFKDRARYGSIRHTKVLSSSASEKEARLLVSADWINKGGEVLLTEKTEYIFRASGAQLLIDRNTTLTALKTEVVFKDIKDGFLGLRVASELEMPSKVPLEFLDSHGKMTKIEANGKQATGMYLSSSGLKGDSVWGTRGRWCMFYGNKDRENISIAIIDHPANVGYPTYWHARGYGLFAANPLGQEIFSKGKEKLNLTLHPDQSTSFRYRVVIGSGDVLTKKVLDRMADEFAKTSP